MREKQKLAEQRKGNENDEKNNIGSSRAGATALSQ